MSNKPGTSQHTSKSLNKSRTVSLVCGFSCGIFQLNHITRYLQLKHCVPIIRTDAMWSSTMPQSNLSQQLWSLLELHLFIREYSTVQVRVARTGHDRFFFFFSKILAKF